MAAVFILARAVSQDARPALTNPPVTHAGKQQFAQYPPLAHKSCVCHYHSEPGGTMKPTLNDQKLRTYMNAGGHDWTAGYPWRSPGYAPIGSPCGLAGGGDTEHDGNGARAPHGVKQGSDGRYLPESIKTKWAAGTIQDVAFSMRANHGMLLIRLTSNATSHVSLVLQAAVTPIAFVAKLARPRI